MLGDGRLARNPNTARYMENHCDDQKPYLDWKRRQWGTWVKNGLCPVSWTYKGGTYEGWRFETVSHATLLPWHDLFYPMEGPKRLQPCVTDLMDAFALAIWYLDDGCAQWWPIITFGMNPPSRGVARGIFEKFGLSPRWYPHRGSTGEFIFDGEEQAERFIELTEPYVPECMQDKLHFGFQGHNYQLRKTLNENTLRGMAAQGIPIRRMATQLGEAASTVSHYLQDLGIPHPRTIGRPKAQP